MRTSSHRHAPLSDTQREMVSASSGASMAHTRPLLLPPRPRRGVGLTLGAPPPPLLQLLLLPPSLPASADSGWLACRLLARGAAKGAAAAAPAGRATPVLPAAAGAAGGEAGHTGHALRAVRLALALPLRVASAPSRRARRATSAWRRPLSRSLHAGTQRGRRVGEGYRS